MLQRPSNEKIMSNTFLEMMKNTFNKKQGKIDMKKMSLKKF